MQEDCFHCQNPVPEKERVLASINGKEEVFCCHGCKTVAELLIDTGKADFYKLRGSSNLEPVQLKDFYTEESLNSEFTYTEYVSGSDETNREVFVNITNIHCSACVWLNEKVLIETEGIKKVRINFASSRAHIVWDDSKLKLYDIFYKIQSIGYKPLLYSPHKKGNANTVQSRDLFLRMAIAGFSFGNIMLFSTSLYAGYFSGIEMEFKKLLHYISWIFATPAFFYSGIPFLRGAFYGLKNRSLNMDSLLAFGVSLAYFYSAYATVTQKGEVYFDSVCMIYFFILLGKYLEALARNKAAEKIQLLLSKLPETVKVLKDGEEKEILSREVKEKDILFIAPGERVAVDGILLDGEAFMDESFMTGESRPVHKKKGDKLLSGSICLNRAITLEASSSYANSSLSHLQTLIETAMLEKPSIQRITDRLASKFITIVFLIAIITFVAWLFYTGNFEKAMVTTVSVLIVACPCALGLSVPISLVMSHQVFTEKGIILKNPDVLEFLSKASHILFDKTGTLTEGKMQVREESLNYTHKSLLFQFIYLLESSSTHPIAKALTAYIQREGLLKSEMNKQSDLVFLEESGSGGVKGSIKWEESFYDISLGTKEFVISSLKDPSTFQELKVETAASLVYISLNGEYIGGFILTDTLKPEAEAEIQRLQSKNLKLSILSGDIEASVCSIAEILGISSHISGMKPEDKLEFLEKLQKDKQIVIMVGDGINDAGCLAKANVGITMEVASDISIDKSDIILLHNHLRGVFLSIAFSSISNRVIKQNIGISLLYNFIMLPLAAFGFMAPVFCALFMTLSSLSVLLNSFLLKYRARRIQ